MMWKIELWFDSDDDDAEQIQDDVHGYLIDRSEDFAADIPWAMITTHGLSKKEQRQTRPLLHSSRAR